MADNLTLDLDALVRAVQAQRNVAHAMFLGAGASVTSNVPAATDCVWYWKRSVFLTNNPGLERHFDDITLPGVQARIQRWLDGQGSFPADGREDEYGFYAERAYPIMEDRRQFFQDLIEGARPHIGYQLLALLARANLVDSVWTSNFDGLARKTTSAAGLTVIDIGLDSTHRVFRPPRRGEFIHVALHGDYRYDALRNTPQELQSQDATLRRALIERLRDSNLIVTGYSGRDQSVMEALTAAYARPGTGRLYWCGRDAPEPARPVQDLIEHARRNGRIAYYTPTGGFDDLVARLSLFCLEGENRSAAEVLYAEARATDQVSSAPFRIDPGHIGGVVKSNAFPITCPSEVLQLTITGLDGPGAWKRVRELTRNTRVVAVPFKKLALALGTLDDVRAAFGDSLRGEIVRSPIEDADLARDRGVITRLLTEALTRSMAESRRLATDGRNLVWVPEPNQQRPVLGQNCLVHDAALLALRRYGGRQYLVIKPTVKGTTETGENLPDPMDKELKRLVLTPQYNNKFNDALNAWRDRLFSGGDGCFEVPPNAASTFRFVTRTTPIVSTVVEPGLAVDMKLPNAVLRYARFDARRYPEPRLKFSDRGGSGLAEDIHPLRGLLSNRPFDYPLTIRGIGPEIRLAVVSPPYAAGLLAKYLDGLHRPAEPTSKLEYLLPYPGFGQALGAPLTVPHPGEPGWADVQEPSTSHSQQAAAVELGRRITAAIEAVRAAAMPNVVLVYVPRNWQGWERFDGDGERFDLHDYVKSFCVQRGIATQFLREETLVKQHQCEVIWWLALSFYAKAFRTPWILDGLEPGTAFMGIGYSQATERPTGHHILLGCSHIYNTEGIGLRYRLSKIEDPIIIRNNPFMSRDDARRVGENARQLFFESMDKPPSRVVIHKRTPFLHDERQGLLDGLGSVGAVDLIELQVDDMLRYVASSVSSDGRFQGDGFPVRRGTAIVLDGRRALLWVHGTAQALDPRRKYYQGRSRVPAPLLMIRHHGATALGTLATEIMGLSKMDWNSFDLYTRLPATLQSSAQIARIGALLERSGAHSYDYRLFV